MNLNLAEYERFKKELHRRSGGCEEDWLRGQFVDDVYDVLFCKYVKGISRRSFMYLMQRDYSLCIDGVAVYAKFERRDIMIEKIKEVRNNAKSK